MGIGQKGAASALCHAALGMTSPQAGSRGLLGRALSVGCSWVETTGSFPWGMELDAGWACMRRALQDRGWLGSSLRAG